MDLSTYRKKTAKRNSLVWQANCLSTEPRTSESFDKQTPRLRGPGSSSTEDVMKGFQLKLLSLLLLLLLSACAYAVEVTARIKGTVADSTGAVLPNITVTATNQDTGVITTTTTLANGDYIFQKLPIGTYSVSAGAPGSSPFEPTGIA